jgi:hypothetical protein
MKIGEVMITIYIQSRDLVEAYIQQGWEVSAIFKSPYKINGEHTWINHLMKYEM